MHEVLFFIMITINIIYLSIIFAVFTSIIKTILLFLLKQNNNDLQEQVLVVIRMFHQWSQSNWSREVR